MFLKILESKFSKLVISSICVNFMLASNISPILYGAVKSDTAVKSASDIKNVVIPADYGKIESTFEGLEDSIVVHIQDVHCNYEAQKNISEILKTLITKNNIKLIGLEGAHGKFMSDKFNVFQNDSVRDKVADYFMKTGKLTGAEYLMFSKKLNVTAQGVEDEKTFIENHKAFLEPLAFKQEFDNYYKGVIESANKIKDKIYSPELNEIEKKSWELEDGKTTLVDMCGYLKDKLIAKGIILKDYKNFARVVKLKHLEGQIDFENVNKEQIGLINAIGKKLSKEEVDDIRQVSISYKNDRMTTDDFFKYLKRLSDAKEVDISRFPNIAFYFNYLDMYSQLDLGELMKEKEKLVSILKEKLFTSENQRSISEITDNIALLKKLFALRVSNDEFDAYTKIKDKMTSGWVQSQIKDIAEKNSVNIQMPVDFKFEEKYAVMDNFYSLAKQRDEDLLENTLSFMKDEDSNTAILISGGFHTQGMLDSLKKKDMSYVVIAPSISKEHDYNLYLSNMSDKSNDNIEKVFSLQLPGSSAIPPALATTEQPFDQGRHALLVHSAILYDIALELADIIQKNISLDGKEKLLLEDQNKVEGLLGGNEYLTKISETLNVSNLNIDYPNIQIEGGNKGVLILPVQIFDMRFKVAIIHPEYDINKTPSKLIGELKNQGLSAKEIPDLNMTIFFNGTSIPDNTIIEQDKFLGILKNKLPDYGIPQFTNNPIKAVEQDLASGIPADKIGIKIIVDPDNKPLPRIKKPATLGRGDSLVAFNIDGSEIIGLTNALGYPEFKGFPPEAGLDVSLYTMTPYSSELKAKAAFPKTTQEKSLGQVLADAGIPQSRIASADKVSDITMSLDGNVEVSYPSGSHQVITVPVPPAESLAEKPSYNTAQIVEQTIKRITDSEDQFIVSSISAPSVLGESGDMVNTAKGLEAIDKEIARLVDEAKKAGVTVIISGTYGNVEKMLDETGKPIKGRYYSYTTNPVPFIYIDDRDERLKTNKDILKPDQGLGSIAPSILEILGVGKPEAMTASSVFRDFEPRKNNRVLLITVDGLGVSADTKGNALNLAREQLKQIGQALSLDQMMSQYPSAELNASGENVGLRKGKAGYPSANYFAIGAGLAKGDIKLDMVKIDSAITDGSFAKNQVFLEAIQNAINNGTKLHILGLVSKAEVSSSIKHLEELLNLAKTKGMKKQDVIIHAITDGLDESPVSVTEDIRQVAQLTERIGVGTLATVGGRYWFMNQAGENSKIEKAYNSLVEDRIKEQSEQIVGVVLLPDDMMNNSLGLREALSVVRQQYGGKVKVGVLTPRAADVMENVLRVNNIADQVDFIVPEQVLGEFKPEIGLIDPVIGFIKNKYPAIKDPAKQIAIITLDINKLGPDAARKAQVFIQEKPQNENEVFSVANGLFAAVMTVDGHENDLANYEGFSEGKPRTLKTIPVEKNFLEQLNRQRQINQIFEASA